MEESGRHMRVFLFALTGMGGQVLEALSLNEEIDVVGLATRHEDGVFPYYTVPQIDS